MAQYCTPITVSSEQQAGKGPCVCVCVVEGSWVGGGGGGVHMFCLGYHLFAECMLRKKTGMQSVHMINLGRAPLCFMESPSFTWTEICGTGERHVRYNLPQDWGQRREDDQQSPGKMERKNACHMH